MKKGACYNLILLIILLFLIININAQETSVNSPITNGQDSQEITCTPCDNNDANSLPSLKPLDLVKNIVSGSQNSVLKPFQYKCCTVSQNNKEENCFCPQYRSSTLNLMKEACSLKNLEIKSSDKVESVKVTEKTTKLQTTCSSENFDIIIRSQDYSDDLLKEKCKELAYELEKSFCEQGFLMTGKPGYLDNRNLPKIFPNKVSVLIDLNNYYFYAGVMEYFFKGTCAFKSITVYGNLEQIKSYLNHEMRHYSMCLSLKSIILQDSDSQKTGKLLDDFQIPLALNEGSAMIADPKKNICDHYDEIKKSSHILFDGINNEKTYTIKLMDINEYFKYFTKETYPQEDDVKYYYAEGAALVDFLIRKTIKDSGDNDLFKSQQVYNKFIYDGLTKGWDNSLKSNYNINGIPELEKLLLKHISENIVSRGCNFCTCNNLGNTLITINTNGLKVPLKVKITSEDSVKEYETSGIDPSLPVTPGLYDIEVSLTGTEYKTKETGFKVLEGKDVRYSPWRGFAQIELINKGTSSNNIKIYDEIYNEQFIKDKIPSDIYNKDFYISDLNNKDQFIYLPISIGIHNLKLKVNNEYKYLMFHKNLLPGSKEIIPFNLDTTTNDVNLQASNEIKDEIINDLVASLNLEENDPEMIEDPLLSLVNQENTLTDDNLMNSESPSSDNGDISISSSNSLTDCQNSWCQDSACVAYCTDPILHASINKKYPTYVCGPCCMELTPTSSPEDTPAGTPGIVTEIPSDSPTSTPSCIEESEDQGLLSPIFDFFSGLFGNEKTPCNTNPPSSPGPTLEPASTETYLGLSSEQPSMTPIPVYDAQCSCTDCAAPTPVSTPKSLDSVSLTGEASNIDLPTIIPPTPAIGSDCTGQPSGKQCNLIDNVWQGVCDGKGTCVQCPTKCLSNGCQECHKRSDGTLSCIYDEPDNNRLDKKCNLKNDLYQGLCDNKGNCIDCPKSNAWDVLSCNKNTGCHTDCHKNSQGNPTCYLADDTACVFDQAAGSCINGNCYTGIKIDCGKKFYDNSIIDSLKNNKILATGDCYSDNDCIKLNPKSKCIFKANSQFVCSTGIIYLKNGEESKITLLATNPLNNGLSLQTSLFNPNQQITIKSSLDQSNWQDSLNLPLINGLESKSISINVKNSDPLNPYYFSMRFEGKNLKNNKPYSFANTYYVAPLKGVCEGYESKICCPEKIIYENIFPQNRFYSNVFKFDISTQLSADTVSWGKIKSKCKNKDSYSYDPNFMIDLKSLPVKIIATLNRDSTKQIILDSLTSNSAFIIGISNGEFTSKDQKKLTDFFNGVVEENGYPKGTIITMEINRCKKSSLNINNKPIPLDQDMKRILDNYVYFSLFSKSSWSDLTNKLSTAQQLFNENCYPNFK